MTSKIKGESHNEEFDGLFLVGAVGSDKKIVPLPYDPATNTLRTSAGVSTIGDIVIRDSVEGTRKAEVTAARELSVKVANQTPAVETGLAKDVTSAAIRDRLPAALDADGGAKVHVQNPTTNPETGLAKEATLSAIAVELLQKTEPSQQQIIVSDRLSQKTGRTYITKQAGDITIATTIHPVTAGKTFYLTGVFLSVFNESATSRFVGGIDDDTVRRVPLVVPVAAAGAVFPFVSFQVGGLLEPLQFVTNVRFGVDLGTPRVSIAIIGYEE